MSEALRLAVRTRALARCEYCQLPDFVPHLMRFHIEHIRPRRHGGATSMNNLAWACARCNERKGTNLSGVDPDTNRVVRLFNPRRDRWSRHFVWDGRRTRDSLSKYQRILTTDDLAAGIGFRVPPLHTWKVCPRSPP
ncbi:MAG: HNH endonuclease [Verrucomicrobia bacterium]|nr:HNH endonuclease [Verrucomicrobiota bacterium]